MRLDVRIDGLPKAGEKLDAIARRAADLSPVLAAFGEHHVRKARRVLGSGSAGLKSRNRSAGLEGSLTYAITGNSLLVGSNKAYAMIHQRGGDIVPVHAKALAIPIGENVRARLQPLYARPADVPNADTELFRFTSKSGYTFLARKKKAKTWNENRRRRRMFLREAIEAKLLDGIQLLFVLLAKVTMPARPYVTHEPADQARWDQMSRAYLVRGATFGQGDASG